MNNGDFLSLYESYRLGDSELLKTAAQTRLRRGEYAMEGVNRTWDPEYNSILEIGVGAKGSVLVCPYEPYCIAAALEGTPYNMTIIERNPLIVQDLIERRYIYHIPIEDEVAKIDDEVWERYLFLIGEVSRTVEYAENGLIFPYWINNDDIDRFRGTGIFSAPIPASFEEGLSNGQIAIVQQTVERFDWNRIPDMSVTLGVAQNVLPYIREAEQRIVLANIREKLIPYGKVLISGYRVIYPFMNFVFKGRHGGWMDDDSLARMGLQVLPGDKLIDDENHGMWFLSRL